MGGVGTTRDFGDTGLALSTVGPSYRAEEKRKKHTRHWVRRYVQYAQRSNTKTGISIIGIPSRAARLEHATRANLGFWFYACRRVLGTGVRTTIIVVD
eukprot:3237965-Rhodomonas_salina.1